jgi:hypothetical protein
MADGAARVNGVSTQDRPNLVASGATGWRRLELARRLLQLCAAAATGWHSNVAPIGWHAIGAHEFSSPQTEQALP